MSFQEGLRLCHLSDPHVGGRKGAIAVLAHLLSDAVERGASHFLFTGDLVERPYKKDLLAIVDLLKSRGLWSSRCCTLLPGNHDVSGLVDDPEFGRTTEDRAKALKAFLRSTAHVNRPYRARGIPLRRGGPILKRLGPVSLLCFSSPSVDHSVEGALTGEDLEYLRTVFKRPKKGPRLVALHHHPYSLPPGTSKKLGRFIPPGLSGGGKLLEACVDNEVDLVLHGHLHTSGRPFDRKWRGTRINCQGTARGELKDNRRRFGYDLYNLSTSGLRRRRYFFDSAAVVDSCIERLLNGQGCLGDR